jgi:hypothetical protein
LTIARVGSSEGARDLGDPGRGLEVIGAGFGRTGTTSLREALQVLGFRPCYHMQTALVRPSHLRFWVRAKEDGPVDFQAFFRHYRAAVDWPACEFYRQLMAAFPEAKIVLTLRDPDDWYDSVRETLWSIGPALPWWFPRVVQRMHDAVIWNSRFKGEFPDRAKSIAVYRAHVEEVRRIVPPGRLLEFDVRQGWTPLCEFLGRPVPAGRPFPHSNDRRFFRRVIVALRVSEWLVPAAVLGTLAWLAFRLL